MIRSIVWFLLVLSLLFNVFFVFGYMQAKASSQLQNGDIAEANRITEFVGNELKLDDKQREVFSRLRSEMRVFNESIALADQELLNELEKKTPDLTKIREMVVDQTDLNNQRRVERSQRFHEFLRTLSPDQCKRLSDSVGRSRHGRQRQRVLKMFDENKNGKLDEDEMVKAKAANDAMREEWRKERDKRRNKMLEQYDSNGDGELDDEERGAMMIKRFDANGDGELDDEEKGAIRENGQRQRRNRYKKNTGPNDN